MRRPIVELGLVRDVFPSTLMGSPKATAPYFDGTMAGKLLILGGLLLPIPVLSQDSLSAQVAELHMLLDSAAQLSWEQAWPDEGPSINRSISQSFERVLSIPMADSTLDRVTRHEHLQRTRSADGRLWAFHWFENTGGSFHSYAHVFHLRTTAGRGVTKGDDDGFQDGRAPYSEIHRLRTKNGERLYLALGEVRTCGSCCAQVAVVCCTGDTTPAHSASITCSGSTTCHPYSSQTNNPMASCAVRYASTASDSSNTGEPWRPITTRSLDLGLRGDHGEEVDQKIRK
jgi:hypothetical protein